MSTLSLGGVVSPVYAWPGQELCGHHKCPEHCSPRPLCWTPGLACPSDPRAVSWSSAHHPAELNALDSGWVFEQKESQNYKGDL